MDAIKYLNQIEAIEQMAKEETIQILKNNAQGHCIEFDCDNDEENEAYCESTFRVMTGDDEIILICAVGLDENDHLIFKAKTLNGFEYNDDEWFEFDEFTHGYADAYNFVVTNLQYAKKH